MANKQEPMPITPTECLAGLSELPFDPSLEDRADPLRRAQMRNSILAIAELNHVSETALVRAVVKNALGKIPEIDQ